MAIPIRMRAVAAVALVVAVALSAATFFGHDARAQTAGVAIQGFKFNPDPITVTVGSTVTWTNADSASHTATATDGSFDTGVLSNGKSGSFTFTKAGSFSYVCSIHSFMHGTVNVVAAGTSGGSQPAATASAPASGGSTPGVSVPLMAGSNLIGPPSGTTLSGSTVYAYDSQANGYTQLGPSDAMQGGKGYWAELDAGATLTIGPGSNAPISINAAANVWQLIGDPSGTQPAQVTGADAVYTYNAATNAYVAATTLNPGQGAWAISQRGGTITITPGGSAAPAPTPTPMPVVYPARNTSPAPVATQVPTISPYPHY